jgi:hypothetical protein
MGRWKLKLLRGLQFETVAKQPADNNEKDAVAVLSVASAMSKAATGSTHCFLSFRSRLMEASITKSIHAARRDSLTSMR